jgi:phosphoglycerate dehydrogenase-like enzyme
MSSPSTPRPLALFCAALLSLSHLAQALAQPATACDFCAQASTLVEQFELSEGTTPVRDRSSWAPPRKIVTMRGDQWAPLLRTAAPDAEIVGVDSPEAAVAALPGADVYVGLCTAAIVEAGTTLKWIHLISAGADACASQPGVADGAILLTSSQGLHSPAVADHALALLLTLARRINDYGAQQRGGRFDQPWANAGVVLDSGIPELDGKHLLVVGLGGIGTEIARRGSAFGMHVRGTRNSRREGPEFVEYVGLADETSELVGWADFVVDALPLTDQTRGLFDKTLFATMKPGAFFINIGRGETVVTDDLVDALESGKLSGAGLDVTDPEPLPPGHRLWSMPNVVLTPHMAAASDQLERRLVTLARENLRRYAAGERLISVVAPRRGY